MSVDANEDAIVGALKQSLRQLETLGAKRAGLEDMLKEMKRKDDILPKLMTSTGSYEDLFRREVAKYDHFCEEIAQNVEAQEHLLLQIQAVKLVAGGTYSLALKVFGKQNELEEIDVLRATIKCCRSQT